MRIKSQFCVLAQLLVRWRNPYAVLVRAVRVPLGSPTCEIQIASGLLARLPRERARLKLGQRCAVIPDTNVGRRLPKSAYEAMAKAAFAQVLIIVPTGETTKSLKTVQTCYHRHAAHRVEQRFFAAAAAIVKLRTAFRWLR